MKRFGLLVTMIFASSLLFTGCGNSSNGNGVASIVNDDDNPIVVIPPGGGGDNQPPAGTDDGEAPVITLIGDDPQEIEQGSAYVELGATAEDAEDDDNTLVINIDSSKVDTDTVGSYPVTYTVEDSDGNVATETRTVKVIAVVDSFPVLSYQSPTVIIVGSVFDPLDGVTASDKEDVDSTLVINIVSNNVDPDTVGEYTVRYSVTDSADNTTTGTRIVNVIPIPVPPADPGSEIVGSALGCDPLSVDVNGSDDANETVSDEPFKKNITSPRTDDLESRSLQTSHTNLNRLSMVVPETTADDTPTGALNDDGKVTKHHPIAVIYLEHVVGSDYEMGDGSADIGDPLNLDQVKVSLSRDDGQTWKDYNISNSTEKSSIEVVWGLNDATDTIAYPGDAQKPKMAVSGSNIVVAWNDKWCPSGNPFGLDEFQTTDGNISYPDDALAVNGPQGFIDYRGTLAGDDGTEAPNGKDVYQVPFSCVWTARGTIDPNTAEITWHAPMQLTSGTRDSNHIWVEGSPAGFAMAWQEDTAGLKAGEGAGPGEGWSGATGNRGTDIWYTSIKAGVDFNTTSGVDDDGKPKSANNFHYPVRITDNEQCQATDKKRYCDYFCNNYGSVTTPKGNQSGDVTRCLTYDTDMLTDTLSILDGDSGASRSALKILKTDAIPDEYVVVLGYEETKALKVRVSGEGEQDQGEIPTDIALEGKAVYFESFDFDAINAFDHTDISTIATTPMPIVSAGNIINVRSPRSADTQVGTPGEMIFENARRLVIGTQIDSCDANQSDDLTFAILYKQSFEVQGASSDMFVRVNNGFTYDSFVALNDSNLSKDLNVTNVSAQVLTVEAGDEPVDYTETWTPANLEDYTYTNNRENTFSPRIFLRGNNIYTGFEYTPYEALEAEALPIEGALFPANFHTNLYMDGAWQGPVNITEVLDRDVNTVDARFFTTPKGSFDTTGLEADKSNPNVLFITWGTARKLADGRTEENLFFRRSTDNGDTWEAEQNLSAINGTTIEEKEVNSFASADGKHIYNVWLQQSEIRPSADDKTTGLDSWFGRVDYNISIVPAP